MTILDGEDSAVREFPECGMLGVRLATGSVMWVGGCVLIHPRVALTAEHVLMPNPNFAVFGVNRVVSGQEPEGGESAQVRHEFVRLPHRLPPPAQNDIAIVILSRPISSAFRPALLPGGGHRPSAGSAVQIVGFGHNNRAETEGFGVQRKARVTVTAINGAEFTAGGGNERDTCTGDSGGPAYAEESGRRIVTGITSRSVQTGDCGAGGIYTIVSSYLEFINSTIAGLQP